MFALTASECLRIRFNLPEHLVNRRLSVGGFALQTNFGESNMKIAVFSDTHASGSGMLDAISEYKPDQVIHLGDGMRDTEMIGRLFPTIPVCCVPGNCDGYYDDEQNYKLISLGPYKAFLTHGHRYAVRGGKLDVLLYAAECCGAQIAMFGHTHRAVVDQIGGIYVINPGTAGKMPKKTWAKLEISENGEIKCEICDINQINSQK